MVEIHAIYECDFCHCKSDKSVDTKDTNKPFPRISYKSVSSPDDTIFDLCPHCYNLMGIGFINNLTRSDLKFEKPRANQDENGNIFYEMFDETDYWVKSKDKVQSIKGE